MPVIEEVDNVVTGCLGQLHIKELKREVVIFRSFTDAIYADPRVASLFRVGVYDRYALTQKQGICALPGISQPHIARLHAFYQLGFASPVKEIEVALRDPLILDGSQLPGRDGCLIVAMDIRGNCHRAGTIIPHGDVTRVFRIHERGPRVDSFGDFIRAIQNGGESPVPWNEVLLAVYLTDLFEIVRNFVPVR